MRIIELFEDNSGSNDAPTMLAIVNQIAAGVEDTGSKSPVKLDAVIQTLQSSGINVSKKDFRELFDQGEFQDVIAGIEGDNITFIGQDSESTPALKPSQTTGTLEKMAKRAQQKRD